MYIVSSYSVAVVLCFITMICWGSWANTEKLATESWPYQLFYWDYVFGALLLSLLFAFTLGSIGEGGRPFLVDLSQASWYAIGSAFLGGVVFNLANILLVVAIDIAGMAVAFPVGIGLALIIGVFVNYLRAPIGDPLILFLGVALVAAAIVLDGVTYSKTADVRTSAKGIIVSILCGVFMGFFYRFVAEGVSLNFQNPADGLMTPYTAVVVFCVGVVLSNFLWNTILMYSSVFGDESTYSQYFNEGSSYLHSVGILGGIIWCIGMSFSMIASERAGFAISYGLGQGAPMVAALWGVFVWDEFEDAPPVANIYIALMFMSFIAGLGLIVWSRVA